MAVKQDYLRWVLEQVAGAGRVSSRRMFGGVGLYRDEVFFAIISGDTLYFKVDDVNRGDYERRGMTQFRPYRDRPRVSMNYYEVPADILEDADECVVWALRAVAAAIAKSRSPGRPKPQGRPGS
ncbi:MAG: regulator of competence-specific s [Gammaproteobacteria bacterium]|nr:regulator of competence-specific s [Gammaproteobacteria bacterium]